MMAVQVLVYFLLWPATCFATGITLGDSLHSVPGLAWLMVLLLSSVSGLAALLGRLRDAAPARFKMFVASHMLASIVSGVVVFFIAEGGDMNDYAEAVAIGVAAYAGAALMDKFAQRAIG